MTGTWVLVLFLKWGYAGGVVAIDMPTEASCKDAIVRVKEMRSYEDATCLPRQ